MSKPKLLGLSSQTLSNIGFKIEILTFSHKKVGVSTSRLFKDHDCRKINILHTRLKL